MKNWFVLFPKYLRSAFRYRNLTLINIFGLAVGLAVAMFLLVYLQFELSFDRDFKDADRIYRILSVIENENGTAISPLAFEDLAHALETEIPEVERASRLFDVGSFYLYLEKPDIFLAESYMVDPAFLQIFDFKVLYGNPEHALDQLGNCVLTRTTAERFFGKGVNPVGRILNRNNSQEVLEVAAVIEDMDNTHFRFDILIGLPDFSFSGLEYYTYLKFRPGTDQKQVAEKCNALVKKMLDERFGKKMAGDFNGITESLTSIHLSTRANFDLSETVNESNLFFIILLTLFILGIAVSNFISLYTIQGERKAMEISIRKIYGADQFEIIKMIFGEAFLITSFSFVLAFYFYYILVDFVASWLNFPLPESAGLSWSIGVEFLLLFIFIAFINGIFPASRFVSHKPKQLIQKSEMRKYRLTAFSVVIQFAVVVFCVASLIIIKKQLSYVHNLPLGFQAENILETNVNIKADEIEGIKAELLQFPFIQKVVVGEEGNPLNGSHGQTVNRKDWSKKSISVREARVGTGFFDLYGMHLLEGNDFSENIDISKNQIILSESTVKALGFEKVVGEDIYFASRQCKVIGVVNDVLTSAHDKIGYRVYTSGEKYYYVLSVQFLPGSYAETKLALQKVLEDRRNSEPLSMVLTTDWVRNQYVQDEITYRILMCGSILAILLALLGLLALNSFVILQKQKNIGIKRVMGAQINEILIDLNRYILWRIFPAIPVGVGLSYYGMCQWLSTFEYAIPMSWWLFALAILATLGVVLGTVFYQTLKAATANPVEVLKKE